MDPERFDEAKLILIWGSNPIVSNLHLWSRVQEAKRRGARVIAIDPYRSLTAAKCDQHVAPLPGTDAALALGMMHVIISEGLYDADYVSKYTHGFEQLKQRAGEYPPEKAAAICGLDRDEIVALAREYAGTRPAAIRLNYGMQRHAGGGMAVRTITCLPALAGHWRDAAGGVSLSTGDWYGFNHAALEHPELITNRPRTINQSALGDALTAAEPPVRAIYVYNTNPVAVCPDSRKVIAGFAREDLFTVVHEIFLTDTTDYADIVLPATTQLEHYDVHKSYGHLYVLANNPAISPLGEAKPNSEVFRLLAARMGFSEACFRDSDEDICRQALQSANPRMAGIEWDALKARGWQRLNVPARFAPFAEGNFPTPSGKCEFWSQTALDLGMDPLPAYAPPRESAQSAPQLAKKYPLAFISPPARNFLNSSFANLPFALAEAGEPYLDIHPADAAPRAVGDGDMVRIYNGRGSFLAKARVSDRVRAGVVAALSVWWKKLSPDGRNANEVTSQALADMGGGATYYDCLVEIERAGASRSGLSSIWRPGASGSLLRRRPHCLGRMRPCAPSTPTDYRRFGADPRSLAADYIGRRGAAAGWWAPATSRCARIRGRRYAEATAKLLGALPKRWYSPPATTRTWTGPGRSSAAATTSPGAERASGNAPCRRQEITITATVADRTEPAIISAISALLQPMPAPRAGVITAWTSATGTSFR
jgi:anaerobic selenocysteine-containing dehydrogenase